MRLLKSLCVAATFFAATGQQAHAADGDQRPNIVLILADDLGFTDLQSYGSEINTPNIAALASQGVRFTNYHTAASCAPTRAMLLTGVDSHRNGVPSIPEAIPPRQKREANHKGVLGHNVITIASRLRDSGYHTYMTGKWHLGHTPDRLPIARGFERTITMPFTGADNWEQRPYLPIYPEALWFADGQPHTLPDDFYSSKYFIDKTIEFIENDKEDDQPFFSYIPFQAVHIPVQAPQEFTDKYVDRYKEGWETLRRERLQSAEALGVVPEGTGLFDTPGTADWDALSEEEKNFDARRMAVYAGMVDAMDHHIGRLVAYLKESGEYENTIFIFTSDNGAEGGDPFAPGGERFINWLTSKGYTMDLETLGTKSSFNAIGSNFATAAASPLAFYKFYTGEGGMRVPLVISGAPISGKGSTSDAFTWVTDIAPTILAYAGLNEESTNPKDRTVEPMIGKSLTPVLAGETDTVYAADAITGFELGGHRALFKGDHKIVFHHNALGDKTWYLFNIKKDPGETNDLSTQEPERFAQMKADYGAWALANQVLPVADNYSQMDQVFANAVRQALMARIGYVLVPLLILVVLGTLFIRRRRRNRTA